MALGDREAFWEEVLHRVVGPEHEVLQTGAEAHFGGEQIVVAEVVHDLEVLELTANSVVTAHVRPCDAF